MKIKVSEATSLQLDWLASPLDPRSTGMQHEIRDGDAIGFDPKDGVACVYFHDKGIFHDIQLRRKHPFAVHYHPTENWSQGGPIIDRECIGTLPSQSEYDNEPGLRLENWCGRLYRRGGAQPVLGHGPTPLIAAMRCFIASRLGDEVDVPEELA